MTNKFVIALMASILTASLILASYGCKPISPSPIVGKWQDTRTHDTIEFTLDGAIIARSNGQVIQRVYELVGSDVIKIKLQRFDDPLAGIFGGGSPGTYWVYKISGNTMTITTSDQTTEMKRVSSPTLPPPANFSSVINNRFFTLTPGTTYIYQAKTSVGTQRLEFYVSNQTKKILGVTCIEARGRVTQDNELIQERFEWYAQDKNGNVWLFGQTYKIYSNGIVISTKSSWESGVQGAEPGIVMEAKPMAGDSYPKKYSKGEAEDVTKVLSLNESITVAYGSFQNCLKTEDFSSLQPGIVFNQFYASDVGLILAIVVIGGTDRWELVNITK